MPTYLYNNVSPPKDMRDSNLGKNYFVPDTRYGHKVAHILHDVLSKEEKRQIFKTANDEDTEDLAEAYRKLQEGSSSKKDDSEDKDEKKKDKKDGEKDEDEDEDVLTDDIYGDDYLVTAE